MWTLERLCHDKLYTKKKKCKLAKQKVEYLDHIVKDGHVFGDPAKTEAM